MEPLNFINIQSRSGESPSSLQLGLKSLNLNKTAASLSQKSSSSSQHAQLCLSRLTNNKEAPVYLRHPADTNDQLLRV